MCDRWIASIKLSIINFMVYSKGKIVFLKSIDASNMIKDHAYIYNLLKKLITEVGRKNVVEIVTDNSSTFVKIEKKFKYYNVYWTSCVAYYIDLMFEILK